MATTGYKSRARILVLDDEHEMGAFLVDLLSDERREGGCSRHCRNQP
jgi:hypothetical protein